MAADTCPVCREPLRTPGLSDQALECTHVLHERCVVEMRRNNAKGVCPLCRHADPSLTPVDRVFANAVEHYVRGDWAEAFRLITQVQGIYPDHMDANFMLGQMYRCGFHVQQDFAIAFELLHRGHKLGNVHATALLGTMYCVGQHVRTDHATAFAFFWQAHERGDPSGTASLGSMFLEGKHVERNFAKAAELLQEAYAKGDGGAATILGILHHSNGDYVKAFVLLRESQAHGLRPATNILGDMFGRGMDKTFDEVAQLLQLAEQFPEAAHSATTLLQRLAQAQDKASMCAACGASEMSLRCSACQKVWYCDRRCQQKDWKLHKSSCHRAVPDGLAQPLPSQLIPQGSSDDVEAGIQASLRAVEEQAAEANAPVVEALFRSLDLLQEEQEQLFLWEFSRHSAEFRNALGGEHLHECRFALESYGYAWEQPSGVKVFVHPCQFRDALRAINGRSLTIAHVVVAESFQALVEAALATIPSRRRRNPRQEVLGEVESALVLDVQHTFLCWVPRDLSCSAVAQSTTVAHGGRNPRQVTNHAT